MELHKEAIPEDSLILWGVGNHGGGASRLDLADIANTAKELSGKGINLIHSDPDTYFKTVDINSLLVLEAPINLKKEIVFGKFEVKTFRINVESGEFAKTDIMER